MGVDPGIYLALYYVKMAVITIRSERVTSMAAKAATPKI
jgi:hypothetical protein